MSPVAVGTTWVEFDTETSLFRFHIYFANKDVHISHTLPIIQKPSLDLLEGVFVADRSIAPVTLDITHNEAWLKTSPLIDLPWDKVTNPPTSTHKQRGH